MKFWVRFYTDFLGEFEYHGPWWISGQTDDEHIVCMALTADDEDDALEKVRQKFDNISNAPAELDFCELKPFDWSPFTDRFPRSSWMNWN